MCCWARTLLLWWGQLFWGKANSWKNTQSKVARSVCSFLQSRPWALSTEPGSLQNNLLEGVRPGSCRQLTMEGGRQVSSPGWCSEDNRCTCLPPSSVLPPKPGSSPYANPGGPSTIIWMSSHTPPSPNPHLIGSTHSPVLDQLQQRHLQDIMEKRISWTLQGAWISLFGWEVGWQGWGVSTIARWCHWALHLSEPWCQVNLAIPPGVAMRMEWDNHTTHLEIAWYLAMARWPFPTLDDILVCLVCKIPKRPTMCGAYEVTEVPWPPFLSFFAFLPWPSEAQNSMVHHHHFNSQPLWPHLIPLVFLFALFLSLSSPFLDPLPSSTPHPQQTFFCVQCVKSVCYHENIYLYML